MYDDVQKNCSDTSQCIPGFFGGRKTQDQTSCSSPEKLFRSSLFPLVCTVRENSPFLGLFHYPRPLVAEETAFVSTHRSQRRHKHYAYRYVRRSVQWRT